MEAFGIIVETTGGAIIIRIIVILNTICYLLIYLRFLRWVVACTVTIRCTGIIRIGVVMLSR